MMQPAPQKTQPAALSEVYQNQIILNIQKLLKQLNLSQNALAEKLRENGLEINQGTISKYFKGDVEIQLSVIVKICDIYNIPITDLIKEDFLYVNREIVTESERITPSRRDDSALYIPRLGSKFITDPSDLDFAGWTQKYFVYFFPTLSSERKILRGTLELTPSNNVCEAKLELNTNRLRNGTPIVKRYTGCAIISTSVHALYVVLSSPEEGELCMLNMRHFFIRHQHLNCRIAAALTNSAGENHAPTTHRVLISREELSDRELTHVMPQLHLNSNDILIEKQALEGFRSWLPDCGDEETDPQAMAEDMDRLIDHLTYMVKPCEMYCFKEDYVRSNALQFLQKRETRQFLSAVRQQAYKTRYNKVSNKVDETVHGILRDLGRYKDHDEV